MNIRKQISLGVILAILTLGAELSDAVNYDEESAIRELGVIEGGAITNGFVFIDGKYIDPPYIVSRRGTGICINGHLVEQPCPWPIPEKSIPVVPLTEDPKMPESITRNTSQYDKELIKYLGDKKAYYRSKYGEQQMVKLMVKVYEELPCVLKAKAGQDENYVTVTWADGNTMNHRLILPKRKSTEWTRDSILKRLEKYRANYEDHLNKGGYYFLGAAHGRMTGTIVGAKIILPVLLPALKTSKDAKEVHQRMQEAGLVFMDERACEAFFTHREIPKELENRVEALNKGEKSNDQRENIFQPSTNSLTK